MGDRTSIEWTGASWTPIRARHKATLKLGWHCRHASPGCGNCYAEAMNKRLGTGLPFKPGHEKDIEVYLDEKMLLAPLKWKKPRKIFVCSMTDLFADFVPDEWIDRMFAVMALCPQHTFQVLTKRSKRMREYCCYQNRSKKVGKAIIGFLVQEKIKWVISDGNYPFSDEDGQEEDGEPALHSWPLSNLWLGVSAEDQSAADERIPDLLATPAAVRFVSAEPLLGPIDFGMIPPFTKEAESMGVRLQSLRHGTKYSVHWIIVGGESGAKARPMHPDWARSIRDQCKAAGTAFFFKQWGEWAPGENCNHAVTRTEYTASWIGDGWFFDSLTPAISQSTWADDELYLYRIGKKRAGRHLDGVIHDAMPQVAK